MSEPKIEDAFAEWDDKRQLFRVFLTKAVVECPEECGFCEGCNPEQDLFLEPEHFPETATMVRLYRAAFCANPKDFRDQLVREPIGWAKRAPAERAAKAVQRELARIEDGSPGPTNEAVRMALIKMKLR